MRAMLIIPSDEEENLVPELVKSKRNENSSRAFILDCPDHSLNNGNTAVFADGAIARWHDALTFYPSPKGMAVENPIPVTDDMLWRRASTTYRPSQQSADGATIRALGKGADTNNAAREMIHDDYQPPTKRPALWQRERQPRSPKAAA